MELVTGICESYSRTVLPVPLVHFGETPCSAGSQFRLWGSGSVSGSGSKADLLRQNV